MAYDLGSAEGDIVITYDGSGVEEAEQDIDGLATSAESSGSKLGLVGAAAGIGITAIAGGFALAVNAAANFEQRMSAISAVSGAVGPELAAISDKALQLGADTAFSATEAASAMEELLKAGLDVPEVLNGAADAAVNLAAAGEIDLPQAATIAANAMNQFGLKAAEMPGIADKIAGAANASAISVSDFGQSMGQVGAVANLVGLSFDDTAQAIALMGNAGIKGSDAGTSLKSMLTGLQPVTEKQTDLMKDLGIITADGANQFFDAEGSVKSFADIADVLGGSLEGMTDQQKTATLETLFGTDAIRAAAVVAEEGAAGFNAMGVAMGEVTAADVAAKRMDGLKGSIEQLKGSWETMLIKVGGPFLDFLSKGVDALTVWVNKAAVWLDSMDIEAKLAGATAFLGEMAAKIGGLFDGFESGGIDDTLAAWKDAVANIDWDKIWTSVKLFASGLTAASPVLSTIVGDVDKFTPVLDLTSEALQWVANHVDDLTRLLPLMAVGFLAVKTAQVAANVASAVSPALRVAEIFAQRALTKTNAQLATAMLAATAAATGQTGVTVANTAADAANTAGKKRGRIATLAMAAAHKIQAAATWVAIAAQKAFNLVMKANPIGLIIAGILLLIGAFIALYKNNEAFRNLVQKVWEGIKTAIGAVVAWFQAYVFPIFMKVFTWIVDAAKWLYNMLIGNSIIPDIVNGIKMWFEKIMAFVMPIFNAIKAFITFVWEAIKIVVITVVSAIAAVITTVFNAIKTVIEFIWNAISAFFKFWWDLLKALFTGNLGQVSEILNTAWEAIKSVVTAVWTAIKDFFTTVWNAITSFISTAVDNLKAFLGAAWDAIKAVITTVWETIKAFFITVWDAIISFIGTTVDNLQSFLSTAWESIKTVITTVWEAIKTFFTTVWNAITSFIGTTIDNLQANLSAAWDAMKSAIYTVWEGIKGIFNDAMTFISGIPGKVVGFLTNMWTFVVAEVGEMFTGIVGVGGQVLTYIGGLPGKILSALGDLGGMLLGAGKAIIQGLINGISSMAGAVGDAISSVASKVAGFWPGSPVKEGPLKILNRGHAGKEVSKMLMDGISSEFPALSRLFETMPLGPLASPASRMPTATGNLLTPKPYATATTTPQPPVSIDARTNVYNPVARESGDTLFRSLARITQRGFVSNMPTRTFVLEELPR